MWVVTIAFNASGCVPVTDLVVMRNTRVLGLGSLRARLPEPQGTPLPAVSRQALLGEAEHTVVAVLPEESMPMSSASPFRVNLFWTAPVNGLTSTFPPGV